MADRPGRFLQWLFAWLVASVAFPRRSVDTLRELETTGSLVYVRLHPSVVDYLYFNLAFLREGLRLVRFANGIRTWALRRPLAGISALLRGRRGFPPDADYVEELVAAGEPALLHLEPSGRRGEVAPGVVAILERLIVHARLVDRPVLLVPKLLIWDKRPDRDRPNLLDDVFGTRQNPGFLRRVFLVFQSAGQAFLNLGQPQVQLSTAVDVRAFVNERSGESAAESARALLEHLRDIIDREQRVVVGPGVKSARQLRDEILADTRFQAALAEAAARAGLHGPDAARSARRMLEEIGADFSLLAVKLFSAALTPVFNQIYDGIEVDLDGLDRVRDVARRHRIVLVPSHKSHVDYLVISYVFFRHGLLPPHIAAGVNLNFWPIGGLFRRSGAFFLRRSFSDDPLYATVFNAYLVKLLEEGFPIEFFIEGTRSRTGKLNPPKYGMLNMIVDAGLAGEFDDVALVPVSVGYENIIEGSSYRRELTGGEKQAENLGALLRTPQVLRSRYGRVYVEFGNPIELRAFMADYHPDAEPGTLAGDELARSVRRLAYRIIHRINEVTTVSPSALAALLLLNSPSGRLDATALVREAGFVLNVLRARGARISRTLEEAIAASVGSIARATRGPIDPAGFDDYEQEFVEQVNRETIDVPVVVSGDERTGEAVRVPLEEALRLLADKKLVERSATPDGHAWRAPDDRRIELSFYRNNIVHYFVADAVFATALLAFRGESPAVDDVRDQARFLSRLLKYEYCFEERQRFEDVFTGSARFFHERRWCVLEAGSTTWDVPTQPAPGAEFMRALLLPTIEAYWVAVTTIAELGDDAVDEKALTRRALALANRRLSEGALLYRETTSRATLETAWRLYREWGLLEQVPAPAGARRGGRALRVAPGARERILATGADIQRLLRHQVRETGVVLREF